MQHQTILESRIFRVERLEYETQAGRSVTRDVVRHPGSVAIVPLLGDGRLCLIRNRRITVDQTLVEIPAGTLEPPEAPLACAHRELAEETGFRAGSMELVTTFYPAPGILDERMYLFVARDLTAGPHAREPGEEIDNFLIDLAEAQALIQAGDICDAKTIIGIQWLLQTTSPPESPKRKEAS